MQKCDVFVIFYKNPPHKLLQTEKAELMDPEEGGPSRNILSYPIFFELIVNL